LRRPRRGRGRRHRPAALGPRAGPRPFGVLGGRRRPAKALARGLRARRPARRRPRRGRHPGRQDAAMRVLLTGAGGYLGSALAEALSAAHEVRTLSARTPPEDGALDAALAGCGAVAHLAALKGDECAADPARAMAVNVDLTRRLVGAAERAGVGSFLFASSYFVLTPTDEYARTKLLAEEAVRGFRGAAVVARIASVFGFDPQGRGQEVVAAFVRNGLAGRIAVSGDGSAELDLVDRRDAVRWLALLLGRGERPALTLDVARGESVTLAALAALVADRLAASGAPRPKVEFVPRVGPPPPPRRADAAALRRVLGPQARAMPLGDAVAEFIAQYRLAQPR
ncbi:SDR family oxidoreductase, partial [bacterium]